MQQFKDAVGVWLQCWCVVVGSNALNRHVLLHHRRIDWCATLVLLASIDWLWFFCKDNAFNKASMTSLGLHCVSSQRVYLSSTGSHEKTVTISKNEIQSTKLSMSICMSMQCAIKKISEH